MAHKGFSTNNGGYSRSAGRPFKARYGGECPTCEDEILPGDWAIYDEDDEVVHEACLAGSRPPVERTMRKTRSSVCPECSLDHAGECF
ncbi:hypothetical protein SEA_PUPPER_157 [Gordonia phage Pupper]|uniref:Uncharacterized protein n=1 Tax=Gordonia phage Pupper TaxID=2571249 RepID=A0A4Y6EIU8_9CAUD|nr:hypothetical protein KHQ83_gp120 [Gordonia phage Pupper]QDF18643.1 hypothetical protein SEA_PUPPER_157 [Gordonia phage Pupper]QDF18875.1 hypothetical protein SEA_SCENTAE_156 [Gordonia phage SCentae]